MRKKGCGERGRGKRRERESERYPARVRMLVRPSFIIFFE